MAKDLFKKLSENAEQEYLRQQEMMKTEGGIGVNSCQTNPSHCNPINTYSCSGPSDGEFCLVNTCNPTQLGNCPGNTFYNGTCPLSV